MHTVLAGATRTVKVKLQSVLNAAARVVKLEFHDADTDADILSMILADTSDTHDFLKLFLWQAERHADILATILARMSVSVCPRRRRGMPALLALAEV